ncbi:MAG: hypothetical protein ABIM74_10195 [candidate division WOR-3 bacterium]
MLLYICLIGAGLKEGPRAEAKATNFSEAYREVVRGDFTTGATSLLYSGSGTIFISDIPPGMVIERAWLVWVCEEYWPTGDLNWGYFNGNYITGTQIAYDCDNCWDPVDMSTLYYADVLPYITGNGTYNLMGFPYPGGFQPNEGAEGATLLIIYCDPHGAMPQKTISVYTGAVELLDCGPQETSWDQYGFTATNPVTSAKYAISVANTQMGSYNFFTLNGNFMGYMYGEDHPGPAWDHWYGDATSLIPGGSTSVNWRVVSDGSDCIEPVLSVISVTSTDALTSDCSLGGGESLSVPDKGLFLLSGTVGRDGTMRLLSEGAAGTGFYIVSATGSVVKTGRVPSEGEFRFSVRDLKPGVYSLVWAGIGKGVFVIR